MTLENHSGIVDNYRPPKGDTALMFRYGQPLYVAVKWRHKVCAVGDTSLVDFYLVNEKNIHGPCTLEAIYRSADGKVLQTRKWKVKASGGTVYGELLTKGWTLPVTNEGYATVEASLWQGNRKVATGDDQLFAVHLSTKGMSMNASLADTSGLLKHYFEAIGLTGFHTYQKGRPEGDYVVVGLFEPQDWGSGKSDRLEWVYEGHTLLIVGQPERWAEFLADKEVADYRGSKQLGKSWYGGNFFVREHRLFEGLPVNTAFNWEYQCFAAYNKQRIGLRLLNGEIVVGCVSDHKKEVYSALSIIPAGRGRILITSLDILSCLKDMGKSVQPVTMDEDGMNEALRTFVHSGKNKANCVGQQLLLNLCRYASQP